MKCSLTPFGGSPQAVTGTVVNVSEQGFIGTFSEPLPILEAYDIIFHMPDPLTDIKVKGRVMWGNIEQDDLKRGIQFYEGTGRSAIREYVGGHLSPEAVVDRRNERKERRANEFHSSTQKRTILPVTIAGAGFYLPDKVVTNQDYERQYGIESGWITKMCGVEERHEAAPSQAVSDLAAIAARRAIAAAGISPDEIDLILLVSTGGDYVSPPTSCIVQKLINAKNASAFDLNAACMGSIWGIRTAASYIATGVYETVLVVASDLSSRYADYNDKNTFILLGDGAGAAVLRKNGNDDGRGVLAAYSRAKGEQWDMAVSIGGTSRYPASHRTVDSNMHKFHMNGLEIYKFAIDIIPRCIEKVMEQAGLTKDEVQLIIPHQANLRILESAQKRSGFPPEKFFYDVQRIGNTGSATVMIAIADAMEQGRLKKNDVAILVGFGAGLAWGATAIRV
jgi:3-oxoacyl-[acyl-carrier-protein] synthase-3